MATNWSNSEAKSYVLLLKNGIQTGAVMSGIMSETQEDVLNYTGEVYRDDISAATLGRSAQGVTMTFVEAAGAVVSNAGPNVLVGASVPTTTVTSITDPRFDQSDVFTHTAPRYLRNTRSRLIWWSAANGTGNVIGHCWEDQYISLTPVEMERI